MIMLLSIPCPAAPLPQPWSRTIESKHEVLINTQTEIGCVLVGCPGIWDTDTPSSADRPLG
jgi:hypothetical protein